jgi:hypothetical protein
VIVELLPGHDSPETAYAVEDYPYGFKLRCRMRWWIETNPKKGQRVWSQTTNPKKGDVWNKAKASIYSDLVVLFLDDERHVKNDGIRVAYSDPEKFGTFVSTYGPALQGKYEQDVIKVAALVFEERSRLKVAIQALNEESERRE